MTKKILLTTVAFGLPWSLIMIIYKSVVSGGLTFPIFITTLIIGMGVGLVFALIMQFMANRLFKKVSIELAEDENIIKEAGANHFKGKEGVGGKLVLTNKRLIFKSHKFNVQNHQDNFELGQIEKPQATKTLGILENGLTIELASKENHKFIVDDSKDWVDLIKNQKLAIK